MTKDEALNHSVRCSQRQIKLLAVDVVCLWGDKSSLKKEDDPDFVPDEVIEHLWKLVC
jgi:hypothetical protein